MSTRMNYRTGYTMLASIKLHHSKFKKNISYIINFGAVCSQ